MARTLYPFSLSRRKNSPFYVKVEDGFSSQRLLYKYKKARQPPPELSVRLMAGLFLQFFLYILCLRSYSDVAFFFQFLHNVAYLKAGIVNVIF